jgi:small GTP-binding protein
MRTASGASAISVRSEKIVLIGAASSGKTSLVTRYTQGKLSTLAEPTIGAAFVSKVVTIDGTDIRLEIWDTGGSERYKALAPMYYRDARAAIIVFDATSEDSFKEASQWLSEFRTRGQPTAIAIVAANKIDLEGDRRVSAAAAADFAFENQLDFLQETSAVTGAGVEELFTRLAKSLVVLPAVDDGDGFVVVDPIVSPNPGCC